LPCNLNYSAYTLTITSFSIEVSWPLSLGVYSLFCLMEYVELASILHSCRQNCWSIRGANRQWIKGICFGVISLSSSIRTWKRTALGDSTENNDNNDCILRILLSRSNNDWISLKWLLLLVECLSMHFHCKCQSISWHTN